MRNLKHFKPCCSINILSSKFGVELKPYAYVAQTLLWRKHYVASAVGTQLYEACVGVGSWEKSEFQNVAAQKPSSQVVVKVLQSRETCNVRDLSP